MTVPYQKPVTYNQAGFVQPQVKQHNPTVSAVAAGASIGAITGAVDGIRTQPHVGMNSENFVKKTYENWVSKGDAALKQVHNQSKKILKKIGRIKTTADLRALFDANKEAAVKYCESINTSMDDYFSSISERTLKGNKEEILKWFKDDASSKLRPVKNWIDKCYDQAQKAFVPLPEMSQEMFDSIRTAAKTGKGWQVAKKTGIFGVVGAAVGFVGYKGFQILKNIRAQKAQQNMINNQ